MLFKVFFAVFGIAALLIFIATQLKIDVKKIREAIVQYKYVAIILLVLIGVITYMFIK